MVSKKLFGITIKVPTNEYFNPFNEPINRNYLFHLSSGEQVPEDIATNILDIHNVGNNLGDFLNTLS